MREVFSAICSHKSDPSPWWMPTSKNTSKPLQIRFCLYSESKEIPLFTMQQHSFAHQHTDHCKQIADLLMTPKKHNSSYHLHYIFTLVCAAKQCRHCPRRTSSGDVLGGHGSGLPKVAGQTLLQVLCHLNLQGNGAQISAKNRCAQFAWLLVRW